MIQVTPGIPGKVVLVSQERRLARPRDNASRTRITAEKILRHPPTAAPTRSWRFLELQSRLKKVGPYKRWTWDLMLKSFRRI